MSSLSERWLKDELVDSLRDQLDMINKELKKKDLKPEDRLKLTEATLNIMEAYKRLPKDDN